MSDDLKRWRVSVVTVQGTFAWIVRAPTKAKAFFAAGRKARGLDIGTPLEGEDSVTATEIED